MNINGICLPGAAPGRPLGRLGGFPGLLRALLGRLGVGMGRLGALLGRLGALLGRLRAAGVARSRIYRIFSGPRAPRNSEDVTRGR